MLDFAADRGLHDSNCTFINTQWQLRSRVRSTALVEGSHTAQKLASAMQQVFQVWGIHEKVKTISTDTAANVKAAVELLQVRHQLCFAHTLNLAVKDAIRNTEDVFAAKSKVKNIVRYFHHSTLANNALKEAHNMCQTVPRKLKQDVDTRWNSTYDMLQSYVGQHRQVAAAIGMTGKHKLGITDEEFDTLQKAMMTLEPFTRQQ